jgi:hypothetical protein
MDGDLLQSRRLRQCPDFVDEGAQLRVECLVTVGRTTDFLLRLLNRPVVGPAVRGLRLDFGDGGPVADSP